MCHNPLYRQFLLLGVVTVLKSETFPCGLPAGKNYTVENESGNDKKKSL